MRHRVLLWVVAVGLVLIALVSLAIGGLFLWFGSLLVAEL